MNGTGTYLRFLTRLLSVILLISVVSCPCLGPSTAIQAQTAKTQFLDSLKFQEIEPGIEYGQVVSGAASKDELTGPWLINVLRVDLQRAELKIVRAMDEGVGEETVSSLAARHQAPAATNGGYFRLTGPYRGESIGLLVIDHTLFSEPNNERAAFALVETATGTEVLFGHVGYSAEISIASQKHVLHGLNRPLSANEIIQFTSKFHRTTLTNPDVTEVVVKRDRVISINDLKGSAEIPADGYVISANGKSREWLKQYAHNGAQVKVSWQLKPADPLDKRDWTRAHSMLAGGPRLIKEGKVDITVKQEKMIATFDVDRHPRTAIAKLASGKVLLVTVDGRQPGVSVGMSLFMLSDLLLELGAVEAMNLDGGGSTTMVIHNKLVNKPSDQTGERPVGDAILVFPRHK